MNIHFPARCLLAALPLLLCPAVQASEPVPLRVNWEVGKCYVFIDRQETRQTITSPAVPAPVEQTTTQTHKYALSVLEALPDNRRKIEMEYLSYKMDMTMGDRRVSFDSGNQQASEAVNPLTATMQHLVGSPFVFIVDKEGRIRSVSGLREMLDKVMQSTGGNAGMAANMLGEENFKKMFAHTFNQALPEAPVAVGDQWTESLDIPLAGSRIQLDLNYTFVDRVVRHGYDCVQLDFNGSMTSSPEQDRAAGPPRIDIASSSLQGRRYFDPDLGMTIASISSVKAMITVDQQRPGGHPTNSTALDQNQVIKLVSVEDLAVEEPGAPTKPKEPRRNE